jgi:hypothetical protein
MTSLFAVLRPSIGRTPESSRATSTPWPLYPLRQKAEAPVSRATFVMSPGAPVGPVPASRRWTCKSGVARSTPGTARTASSADTGTSATKVSSAGWLATSRPPRVRTRSTASPSRPGETWTTTLVVVALAP